MRTRLIQNLALMVAVFCGSQGGAFAQTTLLEDDFDNRGPGELDALNSGNNDGSAGVAWRHNDGVTGTNDNFLDGVTNLEIPMTGSWAQYIDGAVPGGVAASDAFASDLALLVLLEAPASCSIVIGFGNGGGWSAGNQRLIKLLDGDILITADHHEGAVTDTPTGLSYTPDTPQGFMIVFDQDTQTFNYFYHPTGSKNQVDSGWQYINVWSDPHGLTDVGGMLSVGDLKIGLNTVDDRSGERVLLDYFAIVRDPLKVPVELSEFLVD